MGKLLERESKVHDHDEVDEADQQTLTLWRVRWRTVIAFRRPRMRHPHRQTPRMPFMKRQPEQVYT
jgi:hypothetical protein